MMRMVWRRIAVVVIAVVVSACERENAGDVSDVALAQAVRDQFAANPDTKGATARVRVEATDGVVTLSGTVDTTADQALVEQLARRTSGVKTVVNQITVSAPVLPVPDEPFEEQKVRAEALSNGERIGASSEDALIYHAVRRRIVKHESTPKRAIFIDVEGGDVTLRGMIRTTVARDEAIAAARNVEGVRAVRDRLVINTPMP